VRLDGRPVGTFEETGEGTPIHVLHQLAPTAGRGAGLIGAPTQTESYDWPGLHPVFENLLPKAGSWESPRPS